MKNEQFKNNVRIYKSSFSKLYMFSLSVIILFLASYSCYYLLSGYDFGLTAILIFAAGFLAATAGQCKTNYHCYA